MGMPSEVNSILKLKRSLDYPKDLELGGKHQAIKEGYRIIPVDVPIMLVDENWLGHADAIVRKLIWENQTTTIIFEIHRVYSQAFVVK